MGALGAYQDRADTRTACLAAESAAQTLAVAENRGLAEGNNKAD